MNKRIDWFASPLKSHEKFMAALTTTYRKYDINASDCLYMILCDNEDFESEKYKRFLMIRTGSKDRSMEIKRFFLELYENEQDLVDILNRNITQRYFVKNIVIENSKKKHSDFEVNKRMKDALNTVFHNIQL
ncbi:hypothetical protein ACMGDK_11435 [Chryseobacterium sp. DT-3]|uniref:hypothetical protein n=1 Tax=Chryseobacterium sp. DT-3 TaxID=3396164 RepID=UPI003F1BAE7A